jgi:hypothetical protein
MVMGPRTRVVALLTAGMLAAAPVHAAPSQRTAPPPAQGTTTSQSSGTQAGSTAQAGQPPDQPAVQLPQSQLDQIKRAVLRDTRLQLRGDPLRFYLTVEAKLPSVKEMLGSYDLKYGPVANAPMRHSEYLGMMTPRELYGSGGIRAYELLQGAIVNALGQWLVRKAVNEIREARNEREVQEIKERIDRELAALRGGGS